MKLLKKIARRILEDEIDFNNRLIERLKGYARPHIPELEPYAGDQSYNIQFRLDVIGCAHIPKGEYSVNSNLVFRDGSWVEVEGQDTTILICNNGD